MSLHDLKAILPLALARYPDDAPGMAYVMFLSDRRSAGLGALFRRRIHKPRRVWRYKIIREYGHLVEYAMGADRSEHFGYVDPLSPSFGLDAKSTTVRVVERPAYDHRVRFSTRQFEDQAGRAAIAATLRSVRRHIAREYRGTPP